MPVVIDAVRAATMPAPGASIDQWGRFALVLQPSQDPVEVAARVTGDLSALGARVAPLSALEPRILIMELPGRVLGADEPAAFTAAYALADAFDLAAAEPDLLTDLFPETPPEPGEAPVESMEGFPPGCWQSTEPDLDQRPQWALEALRVPQAWDYSTSWERPTQGEGVVVAQPDTGVTRHAELKEVLAAPGFNVLTGTADPTDPLEDFGNPGHGTGTASVLLSPSSGVVTGSAPRARHMSIRAIQSVVRISQVSVAQAIDWAVDHGAHVITMSLGGIFSFALHRSVIRAEQADVIVLAAAGNCVRFVVWPARFDECLAVAGTNSADRPWPGSCRGATVDVAAPGQNVIRASIPRGTGPDGSDVGQGQGTSFAVALTAGVAALWLAHHGRATLIAEARIRGETLQAMFRRLVRATARRPEGWDPFQFGAGIVDASALLEADLDLGRDVESVLPRAAPAARAALTVESLVAEAAGPEAVRAEAVDWHRFGPELSAFVLRQQVAASGAEVGLESVTRAGPPGPVVSESLANAATDPRLRAWLRLAALAGPEVDVDG